MNLRKCPACKEIVGAESAVCPRCGVNFRAAMIRKVLVRVLAIGFIVWGVAHYVLKVV